MITKVAVTDVLETCKDADMLIFVVPHQFMKNMCKPLVGEDLDSIHLKFSS